MSCAQALPARWSTFVNEAFSYSLPAGLVLSQALQADERRQGRLNKRLYLALHPAGVVQSLREARLVIGFRCGGARLPPRCAIPAVCLEETRSYARARRMGFAAGCRVCSAGGVVPVQNSPLPGDEGHAEETTSYGQMRY